MAILVISGLSGCEDPALQQARENKEIARKAFEIVGSGDFENMGDYIAENYTRHSQATPDIDVRSLEDFKAFIRQDRAAVPDQQLVIKKMIAEGDMVAFWAAYKGTQTGPMGPLPATGRSVDLDFSGMHRIENGKIAETWVTWDNVAFLTQTGHFPGAGADQ
jgi:steroid delta-isomerase-like uncharacterized protein